MLAPHTTAPAAEVLRGLAGAVDVHAIASAADEGRERGRAGAVPAAGPARRLGQRGTRPEDVGARLTELRRFADAEGLLAALSDARPGARRADGRRRASP